MTIADIKKTLQAKMDQSIAAFKNNLTKIRTGRANPALLDTIHVEYSLTLTGDCQTLEVFYTGFHSREITKIGIGRGASMLESSGNLYLFITIAPSWFLAYPYGRSERDVRRSFNSMGEHYRGGQGAILIGNGNHISRFYLIGRLMYHRIIKRTKPKLIVAIYIPVIGTCLW